MAIALYLVYLLRKPIGWVLLAAFLAIALSGPIRLLERRMRRGFAITIVYLGLFSIPFLLAAVVVPPIVTGVDNLSKDVPRYVEDLREFVEKNDRLREIDQDYDITGKLQEEAADAAEPRGRRRRAAERHRARSGELDVRAHHHPGADRVHPRRLAAVAPRASSTCCRATGTSRSSGWGSASPTPSPATSQARC